MIDTAKWMTPYWIENAPKIGQFFDTHKITEFRKCPEISHAMLVEGGSIGTAKAQLRHLQAWQTLTGLQLENYCNNVVEVGGGYGVMSRLFMAVNPFCDHYNVFDLPEISSMQEEIDPLIRSISYWHISDIDTAINSPVDMFISCFALSEGSAEMIDWFIGNNFLGAKHVLIAFNNRSDETFPNFYSRIPHLERLGKVHRENEAESYFYR